MTAREVHQYRLAKGLLATDPGVEAAAQGRGKQLATLQQLTQQHAQESIQDLQARGEQLARLQQLAQKHTHGTIEGMNQAAMDLFGVSAVSQSGPSIRGFDCLCKATSRPMIDASACRTSKASR